MSGPLGGPIRKTLAQLQAEARVEVPTAMAGPGHQAGDTGHPPRVAFPYPVAEPLVDFAITTPEPGETVALVHDVGGVGGVAGETLRLYSAEKEVGVDTPNAVAVVAADGTWVFDGDNSPVAGAAVWTVASLAYGLQESVACTISAS